MSLFRIYEDADVMLEVYDRRLGMADSIVERGRADKVKAVERYENQPTENQETSNGHRVNVVTGIGVIDTMFSAMTAVDVDFLAKNIGHGTQLQALAASAAINTAWKDSKAYRKTKAAIKDALLVDIGWVKVYYDYVEDVELKDKPEEAIRAEALDYFRENKGKTEDDFLAQVKLTEAVPVVMRDRVCVDHVPWDMIRYDPSAKRIEDCRWTAQYTRMPVYEVQGNPQWISFVHDRYGVRKGDDLLESIEGDTVITGSILRGDYSDVEGLGDDTYGDDKRVTVVEMWDFETGLVTTFPRNRQDIILYQRPNPLMFNLDLEDRNPFKPLVVRTDPESLEGIGDMRLIQPSLNELDVYRSAAATYIARAVPKLLGPERALTANGRKALESTEINAFVGLEEGIPPGAIDFIKPPPFPQEALQIQERIDFEMKEATGASEPMRGVFPSRRTTAAETNIVTQAGEQRQSERRNELEYWLESIARSMLQLMQVFYDRQRMQRYIDDLGQEFTWEWTKEDIALDADINVFITPREDLSRQERINRMFMWLNLVLPVPEADRGEVLKFAGRELGFREEEIRAMVRSDQEVQNQQQADALNVMAQQSGGAPPGLGISQGGSHA